MNQAPHPYEMVEPDLGEIDLPHVVKRCAPNGAGDASQVTHLALDLCLDLDLSISEGTGHDGRRCSPVPDQCAHPISADDPPGCPECTCLSAVLPGPVLRSAEAPSIAGGEPTEAGSA